MIDAVITISLHSVQLQAGSPGEPAGHPPVTRRCTRHPLAGAGEVVGTVASGRKIIPKDERLGVRLRNPGVLVLRGGGKMKEETEDVCHDIHDVHDEYI